MTKNIIGLAIREQRCLRFNYQSKNDSASRERIIHPYVFGKKAGNNDYVFGLQVEGGLEPGLRMYKFNNMKKVTMIEGSFDNPEETVKTDQWKKIYESVNK